MSASDDQKIFLLSKLSHPDSLARIPSIFNYTILPSASVYVIFNSTPWIVTQGTNAAIWSLIAAICYARAVMLGEVMEEAKQNRGKVGEAWCRGAINPFSGRRDIQLQGIRGKERGFLFGLDPNQILFAFRVSFQLLSCSVVHSLLLYSRLL